MLRTPFYRREEDHKRPVFNRVTRQVHDRMGPHQSSQRRQPAPVRSVIADRSDRSHQRPGKAPFPRQEYRVKGKKVEVQPTVDPKKIKTNAVVHIGDTKVVIDNVGKKLIMFDKSVNSPVQRPIRANDHQAGSSSSASKYFQPRWCPPGSTRTQKRKLQHLRVQEKKEQEIQKLRDKQFNQCRPMVPQGKVWRVKSADQPA